MQDKKQQLEPDMDNRLVPKWERSTSRLYIVTCLFNFYAEDIIQNAGLDDSQARIKIAGRNNNFRHADDTTLMAESEEELKNLLMKVKEESENAGLKLNIQKAKIMVFSPITSWQIDGETKQQQVFSSWAPKSLWTVTAATKLKDACSLEGKLRQN